MPAENRCPTCGALLPGPGSKCPFCAEAQRLLQQLASTDEVRLCAHCGALLQDDEVEYCRNCSREPIRSPLRRDDRITRWLMERIDEPVPERKAIVCPSCGQLLRADAVYCANCNHRLTEEELKAIKEADRTEALLTGPVSPVATLPPRPVAVSTAGEQGEGAVSAAQEHLLPSPEISGEEGAAAEPPAGPSLWQRALDFFREQFAAEPAAVEPDASGSAAAEKPAAPSFWQQILGLLRTLLQQARSGLSAQTLLWALLGLLALGLIGMAVFWAVLMRSGDIIFR